MGSTSVEGMVKALEYSAEYIDFGAVKLVCHFCPRLHRNSPVIYEHTPQIRSIDEWNYHIVYNLYKYVETEFCILVHPDGFVVNPESWREEFLDYDYIGAPWPLPTDNYSYRDRYGKIQRVGNSVSIRSKRLLMVPQKVGIPWRSYFGNTNEDGFISVHNRHIFEEHGCKFASLDTAKYFSHEVMIPEVAGITPFAFHKHAGTNSIYPNFEI